MQMRFLYKKLIAVITRSRTKRISGGDENLQIVFDEPEADLGQVGGFSDAVYAAESDDVRPLIPLGFQRVAQNVHATFRRENLGEAEGEGDKSEDGGI